LLLARQGRFVQAREHLLAVLQLAPTNTAAHYNLAAVFAAQGLLDQAAERFAEVIRLNPADLDARGRLASLLAQSRRTEAALTQWREGLRLNPDWVEGLRGLAWALATHPDAALRDGAEAVRLAGRAVELTSRRDPAVLAALDAAYAEAGRFQEAIQAAEETQRIALASRQTNLAQQATQRMESYRASKPHRE
jgi:tetratricopeptide (TPR) repeat protein